MNEEMTNNIPDGIEEDEPLEIVLQDAKGREYEATVLTTFKAGRLDRDYIAVMAHEPNEDGHIPIQLFRYTEAVENGKEGILLSEIPSDMEFEEVMSAFEKILENTD